MAFPNEVTMSGTLCNVEMKQAQSGNFYLTGGLKIWQGKDKDPAWVDVVVFNNERNTLADYVGDSFGGSVSSLPVIVRGKLEQNTWEDKDKYDLQAKKLVRMFSDNFNVFESYVDVDIIDAAPNLQAAE